MMMMMAYSVTRRLYKSAPRLATVLPSRDYVSSGHVKEEYSSEKETHFGYENVSEEQKAQKVHGVFENVASNYDLMNDLMSGGIHRVWKDCFVSHIRPIQNIKLLDVAGGTGDIAFRIVQHILPTDGRERTVTSSGRGSDADTSSGLEEEVNDCPPPYEIIVCDISQNMLDVGENRAEKLGYKGISWICGDAQKLPFPDDEFDCYTIAFGIRNVVDIEKALDEAYRVLKPGGRFMCLEFSHVKNSMVRWMYDKYSFNMIPAMGQVVAGDWKSYQYLVESIRKFPDQESFKEMIEYAGFRCTTYKNLTLGVAAIHSGFKI